MTTTSTMETAPPTPTQIPVSTPPPASTKCHFCSCAVVWPNVSRMICYAPVCDQVFPSYCYDIGILWKHILPHFNTAQPEHPFSYVACKKDCYKTATRHYANMSANPEDWNIRWDRDSIAYARMTQTMRKTFLLPGFSFQAIMPSSVPRHRLQHIISCSPR
jgi:hypothetical protein